MDDFSITAAFSAYIDAYPEDPAVVRLKSAIEELAAALEPPK